MSAPYPGADILRLHPKPTYRFQAMGPNLNFEKKFPREDGCTEAATARREPRRGRPPTFKKRITLKSQKGNPLEFFENFGLCEGG